MGKIIGNTTTTPNPQPDWEQTDETRASYIKNKPEILSKEEVINLINNNSGIVIDHTKYFGITEDGMAYLEPEYRGACGRGDYPYAISDSEDINIVGSRNHELPEVLIIPEIIGENVVTSLVPGMFLKNKTIKKIVLPKTVTTIPERFCDAASLLMEIDNTENIKSIGKCAFQSTMLRRAYFPLLSETNTSLGIGVFNQCVNLVYAHIGNTIEIPYRAFNKCIKLSVVQSASKVAIIGKQAFDESLNLREIDFLNSITMICSKGFFKTRLISDWWNLSGIEYQDAPDTPNTPALYSTPAQYNAIDFCSDLTVSQENINPLPTSFNQQHPDWKDCLIGCGGKKVDALEKDENGNIIILNGNAYTDRDISWKNITYADGCFSMCLFEAYCGLNDKHFNTVFELENDLSDNYIGWQGYITKSSWDFEQYANKIGIKVTTLDSFDGTTEITNANGAKEIKHNTQILFDALSEGKYVILGVDMNKDDRKTDHAVLAYGIRANKEVLIADSDSYLDNVDIYESLHFQISLPHYCISDHIEDEGSDSVPMIFILDKL